MGEPVRFEVVATAAGLAGLEPFWNVLCDELGETTSVFSSHPWYTAWWHHFGAGAEMRVVVMWAAGRLVGIAPLLRKRDRLHGLPVTALAFLENQQSLHNDFIVLPAWREKFFRGLAEVLFQPSPDWQILSLRHLPQDSPNAAVWMDILAAARIRLRWNPTWINSPFLVPAGSWRDHLANRPPRLRKTLRNVENRLQRAGAVAIKNFRTWAEFLAIREELFALAGASWSEGVGDSIASPQNRPFFESLAAEAAARGWLSLWALYLNGRMIAAEFHLRAYGQEHALRGHYHPEFASLSPGTYLEAMILQTIFDELPRVGKYDFCGSFEKYKGKWTDTFVAHSNLLVFNNDLYSRLLWQYEGRMIPWLVKHHPVHGKVYSVRGAGEE